MDDERDRRILKIERQKVEGLRLELDIVVKALWKIYDPMKYHHWEEDPYARAGCFQFVAQEALKAIGSLPNSSEKE